MEETKMEEINEDISPEKIFATCFAFAPSRILVTGVDLDVFTHITNGHNTARDIANVANANARGMEILLNGLTAIGFLTKSSGMYYLTDISEKFLVKGLPSYYGDFVSHVDMLWEPWRHLTEVVRTGNPFSSIEKREEGEKFFEKLVLQLVPMSYPSAKFAADALEIGSKWKGLKILDVAAGSGAWGVAFAQKDPSIRVTFQDWSYILNVTKKFVSNFSIDGRYDFLPGDLREIDFGENIYDLVILGHICHSEGAENTRILLSRVCKSLKDEGKVLIADMIPDDERSSEVFPLLFAVNMLINTTDGNTFTMEEYRKWLTESGFHSISTIDVPGSSPLIIATK